MEQFSGLILKTSDDSSTMVLIKYASFFSKRRVSFENIETTSCMVGLSVPWSCTHNRPIWMHLNTSNGGGNDSTSIVGFINS